MDVSPLRESAEVFNPVDCLQSTVCSEVEVDAAARVQSVVSSALLSSILSNLTSVPEPLSFFFQTPIPMSRCCSALTQMGLFGLSSVLAERTPQPANLVLSTVRLLFTAAI